jgi:hypothetical protein
MAPAHLLMGGELGEPGEPGKPRYFTSSERTNSVQLQVSSKTRSS